MRLSLAAVLATAWTLLALPQVLAHQESHALDDTQQMLDCHNLPSKALTQLPAPMNDWARLECVPAGQMLVQGKDWTWRYPASFTTPVHIPAWSVEPAAAASDGLYFVEAQVSVVRGEQAKALESRLANEVQVYASMSEGKPPVADIYTLTTMNSAGHRFDVHFLYRSDQDIWAMVCAPDCRSDFSFVVNSGKN
ncbi:MAG TPA: hypothetical protein VFB54_19460 [Burkholderiales bacterium]|nr:hypothetical protein [Burkholderiales bacterium]